MKQEHASNKCKTDKTVKIMLDGEKLKIESRRYTVSDLKKTLSVPAEYELELIEDGQFRALSDNEEITICGKEEFVSHVKSGGGFVMTNEDEQKIFSSICSGACFMSEAGITYIYLPNLKITTGGQTRILDALLCPVKYGGYTTRLFLAKPIQNKGQNWTTHVILSRTWHTWSWNHVPASLASLQILSAHLRALV